MNKFTVIGFYEETGQIFSHHIEANNSSHAFYVVAQEHESANLVTVIDGHLNEGQGIEFAGDRFVDSETICAQPEVFNLAETVSECNQNVIADFSIQDWHIDEVGNLWNGPKEHRDTYRFVIEQSKNNGPIYFKLYPKHLDDLSTEISLNGLSGVIEIRNGKPGISIGINENDLPVHVESDIYQGLYIHSDNAAIPTSKQFYSFDHGMNFDCAYYKCGDDSWLMEARSEIANHLFESHDYGESLVTDTNGWRIADTDWVQRVYFENPNGGDSIAGNFELTFGNNSTLVTDVMASSIGTP
jgi:hypothetical protein